MEASHKRTSFATHVGQLSVLLVLIVVVIAFLAAHVLAWRWATQPFLGLMVEPTLVLSPLQGKGWARLQFDPPLEQPDRLIAINGHPVERYADVADVLSRHKPGDAVWVLLARPDGDLREELITLTAFSLKDMFLLFLIPYLAGMAYLGFGVWVYWVQGWGRAGPAFTGLCAALALTLGCLFDLNTTHRLAVLWCAAVPFAAAAVVHLALVFPQEPRFVRRAPVVCLLPYLPATYLALRSIFSVYDVNHPWEYIRHWRNGYLFAVLGILFLIGTLSYRLSKSTSPLVRRQSRVILLGSALAFLPVVPWLVLNVLGHATHFLASLYAPLFAFFPISIAYAILRYRLMDVDQLLSRGLAYGALTFLIVAAYFALTNGLSRFFAVKANDPILLSLFVLTLVLLFNPLRNRAQQSVDRVFFREPELYSLTALRDFSRQINHTLDLDAMLAEVAGQIENALHPTRQWVCLYDETRNGYVVWTLGKDRQAAFPVIVMPKGALAQWLQERQEPLYLPPEREPPVALTGDWAQIGALGVVVCVPLCTGGQLIGWLALNARHSGKPYRSPTWSFSASWPSDRPRP